MFRYCLSLFNLRFGFAYIFFGWFWSTFSLFDFLWAWRLLFLLNRFRLFHFFLNRFFNFFKRLLCWFWFFSFFSWFNRFFVNLLNMFLGWYFFNLIWRFFNFFGWTFNFFMTNFFFGSLFLDLFFRSSRYFLVMRMMKLLRMNF